MASNTGPLMYRPICRNRDCIICRCPGSAPDSAVMAWKKWMRSLAKKLVNNGIYVLMTGVNSETPSSILFLSVMLAMCGTVN